MTFFDDAMKINDEIIAMRRDFHKHPELGFQEIRTSGIIADKLEALGLEVTTGIAETGVIGLLRGQSEMPVLLLRFDMDALPIAEDTGVPYTSINEGKMHACGHDSHVAIGLGTAKLLAEHRDKLPGTIKFVFQPAEEGDGGAARMIEEGVLENPSPDYVMSIHVWNEKPVGEYIVTRGPLMAGAEIFNIRLTGKGGHGAAPHKSVDPVVAASQIISALQTITSRNLNPLDSAVVSVCEMKAGSAFNIIPQEAVLAGTIRTFTPQARELVKERFNVIVTNIASAMKCQAEIDILQVTYPVGNDVKLADLMERVIQENDPKAVVHSSYRTMGSEDFSLMMQDIPGFFLMVGSANADQRLDYGHHHPKFNIDEACLPYGVAIMAQGAVEILTHL